MTALQSVGACTTPPTTPEDCFSTLLTADVPTFVMFPIAVLGIVFGALYGMYFEFLPGRGYAIKAVAIGLLMFIFMVFFDVTGNVTTTDQTQLLIMRAFDSVALFVYAAIIARFYRRYTREVKFESSNPERLKFTVDGKDYTGRTRTLSLHSTHTIRAPGESGGFKGWLVSGGVSVVDPRSFETTMRVDGDGLLKIS